MNMHVELFLQTSAKVVNGKIIGKYARVDPHSTLPARRPNLILSRRNDSAGDEICERRLRN